MNPGIHQYRDFILKMQIKIHQFDVHIGADTGAKQYTINIPALKIFKHSVKLGKFDIDSLESTARELIEEKINQ